MAKAKTIFFCNNCGYESSGWLGKCPSCGTWNSFVEETINPAPKTQGTWLSAEEERGRVTVQSLAEISAEDRTERELSGISELDRVLGGGFVNGSLILVGGDPGIGKSTLLLQCSASLAQQDLGVLYVSGEESPQQIRLRANRLGLSPEGIDLMSTTNFDSVAEQIKKSDADFVVIDSIQTIYSPQLSSAPGSVSQVRESAAGLLRLAKNLGVTIVLLGHVTKEGNIAGPRVLEHMVDTVIYFEGDISRNLRILRCVKNRFGSTDEIGIFEMQEDGLHSVSNPTMAMLAERPLAVPGTATTASLEGTRPILLEIQALLSPSHYQQAVRMSQGVDRSRLGMLLAVIEKFLKKDVSSFDCYLNVIGGLKVKETACDLAIVASILSSMEEKNIPHDMLLLGEIGLTGELRSIRSAERRVQEAMRLGWKNFVLPSAVEQTMAKNLDPKSANFYYVSSIREAVDLIWSI